MIKLVFAVSFLMALQEVHLQRSPYAGSANRFRGLPTNIVQEISSLPSVSSSPSPIVTEPSSTLSNRASFTQQPEIVTPEVVTPKVVSPEVVSPEVSSAISEIHSPYAGSVANRFHGRPENVPSIGLEVASEPSVIVSSSPVTSTTQQPETVPYHIPKKGRFSNGYNLNRNYDQFRDYHHHHHYGYDFRGERDFDVYD